MSCPCGNQESFEICCEPFVLGKTLPETAEKLMRSRYTAYTLGNIDYIQDTLAPESSDEFDTEEAKDWAKNAKWKKLKILSTKKGGPEDKRGTVEFTATYEQDGETIDHHETSQFRRTAEGRWLFVEGDSHTHKAGEHHHHHHHEPVVREAAKVGRNDTCTCGSGKKFKKCCGA